MHVREEVKSEDCSGGLLGKFPQDLVVEEQYNEGEEEEPTWRQVSNLSELRKYLECRRVHESPFPLPY